MAVRLEAEGAVLALGPRHLAALCGEQVSQTLCRHACLRRGCAAQHAFSASTSSAREQYNGASLLQVTLYQLSEDAATMCAMLLAPSGQLTDVQLNSDYIALLADGAQASPRLIVRVHPLPC